MSLRPEPRSAGAGRRTAVLTCVLLITTGLALISWALTHQLSPPEAPFASVAQPAQHLATGGHGPEAPARGRPALAGTAAKHARPAGLSWSRPARVVIPSIGVDSQLQELGVNPDGTLQVPTGPRYNEAGWFTGSPTPGQVGPAVIVGHVDARGGTPSVFFKLGALKPGDHVQVTRSDQRTVTFTVYRVERYAKDQFPTGAVYGNTAGPELRLITCGGPVDPASGRYLDNTVAYARLAAG